MDRPNWGVLEEMFADVQRAWSGIGETQRRMLELTGVAWSDDRMIKAVVGPRGHLIELDIDPRIFRKPNSKALSAAIVATTRRAVEDVARQTKEILEENVPSDLRRMVDGQTGLGKLLHSHDAQVREELEKDDA
jgi:hypothetical protein